MWISTRSLKKSASAQGAVMGPVRDVYNFLQMQSLRIHKTMSRVTSSLLCYHDYRVVQLHFYWTKLLIICWA